jgi:hypothetical protein
VRHELAQPGVVRSNLTPRVRHHSIRVFAHAAAAGTIRTEQPAIASIQRMPANGDATLNGVAARRPERVRDPILPGALGLI